MADRQAISLLADYLTLVYHEARNVRHLIKKGYLSLDPWANLISLPTNRVEAWRSLQTVRREAASAESATAACAVFAARFNVTLEQLVELYMNPAWKNAAAYGGSAWHKPTRLVIAAAEAIDFGDESRALELLRAISASAHNTGLLSSKLQDLDGQVDAL